MKRRAGPASRTNSQASLTKKDCMPYLNDVRHQFASNGKELDKGQVFRSMKVTKREETKDASGKGIKNVSKSTDKRGGKDIRMHEKKPFNEIYKAGPASRKQVFIEPSPDRILATRRSKRSSTGIKNYDLELKFSDLNEEIELLEAEAVDEDDNCTFKNTRSKLVNATKIERRSRHSLSKNKHALRPVKGARPGPASRKKDTSRDIVITIDNDVDDIFESLGSPDDAPYFSDTVDLVGCSQVSDMNTHAAPGVFKDEISWKEWVFSKVWDLHTKLSEESEESNKIKNDLDVKASKEETILSTNTSSSADKVLPPISLEWKEWTYSHIWNSQKTTLDMTSEKEYLSIKSSQTSEDYLKTTSSIEDTKTEIFSKEDIILVPQTPRHEMGSTEFMKWKEFVSNLLWNSKQSTKINKHLFEIETKDTSTSLITGTKSKEALENFIENDNSVFNQINLSNNVLETMRSANCSVETTISVPKNIQDEPSPDKSVAWETSTPKCAQEKPIENINLDFKDIDFTNSKQKVFDLIWLQANITAPNNTHCTGLDSTKEDKTESLNDNMEVTAKRLRSSSLNAGSISNKNPRNIISNNSKIMDSLNNNVTTPVKSLCDEMQRKQNNSSTNSSSLATSTNAASKRKAGPASRRSTRLSC